MADHVPVTCAECGKPVQIYNDNREQVPPAQGGCWYCNKRDTDAFCCEFYTYLHLKCVIDAIKRDRHPETVLIFNEFFMVDGDVLLNVGDRVTDNCFDLEDDAVMYEIPSAALQARTVLEGELIIRGNGTNLRKAYLKGVQE